MSCQPREKARRSQVKRKTAEKSVSVGKDLKAKVTSAIVNIFNILQAIAPRALNLR